MKLLKQPIENSEYYVNKFAADLASRVANTQWVQDYYYHFTSDAPAVFTTFALFVKRVLLEFLNDNHTEYTLEQTIAATNEIAYLSGRGRDKYEHGDVYNCMLCTWCWAFAKGFSNAAEKSEEIKMAKNLWTRHADGSASLIFHHREFLIETPDVHDTWSRDDYGIIEKWYALEDEDAHYFLYKVFPSEYEARLFIADLVMKINGTSWYKPLEKATGDITDAMAEIYVADKASVWREVRRCQESDEANNKPQTQLRQRVYIMHFKDGINKIGISTNIETRTSTKEKESGRVAKEVCATDFLPDSEAKNIEHACHKTLEKYETTGEFFDCSYEEAQAVLQQYSPITVRLTY
ncbi:MAG: GIY-YIG nuclease family protein [Selenomonadaceae bacterium]|nr:GIY-YIG nuclease family protein [Selenomonadaceae bacterium]